jgi:hypothetical protein
MVAGLIATLAICAASQSAVFAANQPVVVTNTTAKPVPTIDTAAQQPFQANIYINIANGASGGGDNSNVSPGTQTILIPPGKRLVVQTVSVYRSGAISTQTVQVFINSSVGGAYCAFATPIIPASTASYVGIAQPMTFYSDGNTRLLANAFRAGTTGAESETVTISGYLVNVP